MVDRLARGASAVYLRAGSSPALGISVRGDAYWLGMLGSYPSVLKGIASSILVPATRFGDFAMLSEKEAFT